MLTCLRLTLPSHFPNTRREIRRGFRCRAQNQEAHDDNGGNGGQGRNKTKVVIVGSGWAGLGAAHHLSNQVFPSFFLGFHCFYDMHFVGFRLFFLKLNMKWWFPILFQGFDVTVIEGDKGFGYPDTIATRGNFSLYVLEENYKAQMLICFAVLFCKYGD